MFDLRYHVASLAAVFLALVIGIVLGVGISDRGFVRKGERALLEDRIARLERQLDTAREREANAAGEQRAAEGLIDEAYPEVIRGRLAGKRIAIVFVGSVDASLNASIARALSDADAPPPVRLRALKVPLDVRAVDRTLAGKPALAGYVGDDRLPDLGRELGSELVIGGETPLWDALSGDLVEERQGGNHAEADGVVVVRSAPAQRRGTARFLKGFYSGLADAGVPAVGIDPESEGESRQADALVKVYRRAGLSTVDSVETAPGRLALVLLLAGGRPGSYGIRQPHVLPPFESVPALTTTGG